jgi:D-alanyl-D-alanine carboxypeptidase
MDARTGELLYSKSPDTRLPPASTTKVMTAVVALESGKLRETASVSRDAAATQASKLYLRAGERAPLDGLMHAVLLKSANDASVVVAEAVGGSVPGFASRMNRRAAQLGATNTRFVNPNGLPATGHYSTARDLARIFRHALSVPGFREMAATKQSRVTATAQTRHRSFVLRNTNRLLTSYRVPVIGKTGYTHAAKRCFVGSAREGDREIVIALLGSTDMWGDARRLLDFGLSAPPATVMAGTTTAEAVPGEPAGVFAMVRAGGEQGAESASEEYSLVLTPSHNSRDAAERLRHFIDRRGHQAVVETSGKLPDRQYHVRVVGLPTRDAALRAQSRLEGENLRPTLIPPG